MTYAGQFHRLVIVGDLYADTFNTTLAMVPAGGGSLPAVTPPLLAAVADVVATWFPKPLAGASNDGIGIMSMCKLTSIKLNRIGVDGRYVDDETLEHVYPTPIAGGYATVVQPQLTLAMTLRGTQERSRAGKGRMYFPPSAAVGLMGSDGRIPAATALSHAKGGLFLLSAINDAYIAQGVNAVAGIASRQGTGAFQGVAQVSVGRVIDTIRSRRNKLPEDPQYWGAP